jgi:hypothetical protein
MNLLPVCSSFQYALMDGLFVICCLLSHILVAEFEHEKQFNQFDVT